MIKIVHLISDLSTGGAEMMLYKLLSRMNRRFTCTVVSMTDAGTLGCRIEALGVPVFILDMRRGVPSPLGLWRLLRLLRKERPQILHTLLYHADLLGLVAGKLARVPVIVWNLRCSDMDMRHYPKLSALVLRLLAKLSAFPQAVMVNSDAGRRFHEALGYRPPKWQVVPNGFDLECFTPNPEARVKLASELGLPVETLLIGLIARYDPVKDHLTFVQAASALLKVHTTVHFVLAGLDVDGRNKELTRAIANLGVEEHIHLLGERNDVPSLLAALDIATSSSSCGEGFSNVIGEAMACGIPCVVTNVGDSARIVGNTGRVVPPRNPQALADAWAELIALGQDGRKQLGLAARQRVKDHFSLSAIVSQYEKCYEELANNN